MADILAFVLHDCMSYDRGRPILYFIHNVMYHRRGGLSVMNLVQILCMFTSVYVCIFKALLYVYLFIFSIFVCLIIIPISVDVCLFSGCS